MIKKKIEKQSDKNIVTYIELLKKKNQMKYEQQK